ncbi:hypothetical protein Dd1591_3686 [Dickeya chrysanthemi Ech1591]|uniref:Uncharacterized protein n=1 Tax=Dickeya chrysanthemi (strain Ech1591) TaxID=561229 RepID=C6CLJ1_DICC1|nr:hypothetical protein Dd1591_3686 [Dickeya chrysanthemi Ech1591]
MKFSTTLFISSIFGIHERSVNLEFYDVRLLNDKMLRFKIYYQ